jgi:hypothetical protein
MRTPRSAPVLRAVVLIAASHVPATAIAGKRVVRHFPTFTWCSVVSGHATDLDLVSPYTFTVPAGLSKATVMFKADNVLPPDPNDLLDVPEWNQQRLDSIVVLSTADLPVGEEPRCFFDLDGGSTASPPRAFPVLTTPAAFRDDFVGGAKPEWGSIPAGNGSGEASAPVFWSPATGTDADATLDIFHENFEDGEDQGWTTADVPDAINLWLPATNNCFPDTGSRHAAFALPEPDCLYDVGGQGRVGGTYTSPILDLSTAGRAFIEFRHRWDTAANSEAWVVEASADGGQTWTAVLQEADLGSFSDERSEKIETAIRSAQFRFRFHFDSGPDVGTPQAGAGWYIDNLRVTITQGAQDGSLALGRSTQVAGQFVDAGEVTARLNLTNLTPNTEYAIMARWTAAHGSSNPSPPPEETVSLTLDHLFDSAAPTNPTLTSTSHVPNVWSENGQVAVQWSGAADETGGAGLAGYSTAFDSAAATTPDTTVETAHATDPHSSGFGPLPDGGSYYFHLRTCDLAVNCSAPAHLGPFRIDRVAPSTVSNLTSPTHTVAVPSLDRTIDVTWWPATDATSGVDGYAFIFDNNATWVCDQAKDVEESATGTTSATLAVGTWYFHVCTRDNAGHWSTVASVGPYTVSGQPPSSFRLYTLAPCRLIDTRNPAPGPHGGPALVAGDERSFPVDLACGIPAGARALSVNITVVSPTAAGDLRLYPPGGGVPLASVINYSSGQTRANNAIVPLDSAQEFAVRCDQASGTVHLLVDVNGYLE